MRCVRNIRVPFLIAVAASLHGAAHAQGTGAVSSPVVKPGASISLAGGIAIEDNDDNGFAQRIDYRHTVTDGFRVGALLSFDDRGGRDFRYRRLTLETTYQFASRERGWNSAIQFRGRIPDGNDGPGRVRVAWLNRWRFDNDTELRLMGIASRDFGANRDNGFVLETRGEVTWRVATQTRVGAQLFNRFGSTAGFGSFASQRHSVGAVTKGNLTKKISYRVNALAGLSPAATDLEFRASLQLAL